MGLLTNIGQQNVNFLARENATPNSCPKNYEVKVAKFCIPCREWLKHLVVERRKNGRRTIVVVVAEDGRPRAVVMAEVGDTPMIMVNGSGVGGRGGWGR